MLQRLESRAQCVLFAIVLFATFPLYAILPSAVSSLFVEQSVRLLGRSPVATAHASIAFATPVCTIPASLVILFRMPQRRIHV